jgi:hypothetical protein
MLAFEPSGLIWMRKLWHDNLRRWELVWPVGRVGLGAYQFGRLIVPKVQSAGPEFPEFMIEPEAGNSSLWTSFYETYHIAAESGAWLPCI